MVICLEQGADLHMAQLMPLSLTVSCFSKIQISFTCLVLAHMGSPWMAVKCVCSSVYYYYPLNDDNSSVQLLSQFFGCATPTEPISIGAVVVLHPLLLSRHLWSWIQQVLGWPTIRKQTVCLWVVILSVRGSTHSYSPYCKPHFSPCSHFFHINTCNWQ